MKQLAGFAFSDRGENHRLTGTPCQEASQLLFIARPNGCELAVAAVAAGVGAASRAGAGAHLAVKAAVDTLRSLLEQPGPFAPRQFLQRAFQAATSAIETWAQEEQTPLHCYDTTLTCTIFDGSSLFIGHCGDGGVVAAAKDGACKMATRRIKCGEAAGVVPLRDEKAWAYFEAHDVASFAMMTGGLLDASVGDESLEDRVYTPFFSPILGSCLCAPEDAVLLGKGLRSFLTKPQFIESIRDDRTFVFVMDIFAAAVLPSPLPFDEKGWEEAVRRRDQRLTAAALPAPAGKGAPCILKKLRDAANSAWLVAVITVEIFRKGK